MYDISRRRADNNPRRSDDIGREQYHSDRGDHHDPDREGCYNKLPVDGTRNHSQQEDTAGTRRSDQSSLQECRECGKSYSTIRDYIEHFKTHKVILYIRLFVILIRKSVFYNLQNIIMKC